MFPRKTVIRQLNKISTGRLKVKLPDGEILFFGSESGPEAEIFINNNNFFSRILLYGDIGFAESYMAGEFTSPDLAALLKLLAANAEHIGGKKGFTPGLLGLLSAVNTLFHYLSPNSIKGSGRNIRAHYDLTPQFFSLFLDKSLTYSAALYQKEKDSLHEAQIRKIDYLAGLMALKPGMRVLEIGSGWGEFSCRLASEYGVQVDTLTLSPEQKAYADAKKTERKIMPEVNVLLQDYRTVKGVYDAIVSVEMIEAVGRKYLSAYFRQCSRLLKPGGQLVIQAITIPDRFVKGYLKKADFIQKYIFPGGFLPSVTMLMEAASEKHAFDLIRFEDQPDDYARTLNTWRKRFSENIQKIKDLGFDDLFIRMWDYYLAYCEAGFETRSTGLARMVFRKPG